jgi:hypothetical protein
VSGYHCVVDSNSMTATCVPNGTGTGGTGTGGTGTGGMSTGGMSTGGTTTTTTSTTTTTTNAPIYCGHPSDCAMGEICSSDGVCKPGPCSATNACIYGYTCASDGTCQSTTQGACETDTTCTGGSLCIAGSDGKGGVCTPTTNQCFDQSQCGTGEVCVAGKCTLGCKSNTDCRDGFNCDTTKGICSVPVKTCTITNDCGGATQVCVAGTCVPRSNGGTCSNKGDVWDENGCIPNQGATFNCATDGQMGSGTGTPGVTCQAGSICLHHDCWISCDPTMMPNACTGQTILNTCKPVVDNGMTYNVCGTPQNLGNQCGAGAGGMMCTGSSICIDGFCK